MPGIHCGAKAAESCPDILALLTLVLTTADQPLITQVTYVGGTVLKRGDDCGQNPVGSFTLSADEQIIVVSGGAGYNIDRIGFTTSKGNTYGPWGGTGGSAFRLEGPVYGFYGGINHWGQYYALGGVGTWTDPTPTPAAPSSPPSPPILDMRSPVFGSQNSLSLTWDDRAAFPGQCQSCVKERGSPDKMSPVNNNALFLGSLFPCPSGLSSYIVSLINCCHSSCVLLNVLELRTNPYASPTIKLHDSHWIQHFSK
jgi:hypothetical protein